MVRLPNVSFPSVSSTLFVVYFSLFKYVQSKAGVRFDSLLSEFALLYTCLEFRLYMYMVLVKKMHFQ